MAKEKPIVQEKEYTINLRREILKVPRYRRTPKAVKAIKQFIAKHMRVPERDLKKVKLDKYLNQELWFRGIQNPPTKIKVKAKRSDEKVIVSLAEIPEIIKYKIAREEKVRISAEKIKEEKKKIEEKSKDEKKETIENKIEEKTENKVEEKEKEVAVAESMEKQAEIKAKEQKHMAKIKPAKTERIQRKALQK